MLVKCKDTGEKIDKSLAFKGKDGYYSSEDAYNAILLEKELKKNLVKCVDTGEKIDKRTAFVSRANNGTLLYYSSEQAYLDDQHNKRMFRLCTDTLGSFCGYFNGAVFPTNVMRRFQKWHQKYSYEMIYEAMLFCSPIIEKYKSKSFDSEAGRANYYMAIIEGHLNDGYKIVERNKTIKKQEVANMSAAEDEVDYEVKQIKANNQPSKTVASSLLEDLI